ncbi:hypothetical protein OJF2_63200 [Aquisphaera giovannonii]|uniref:Insertion element IS402-like domain-containing protein n=1 Tax=Aquisphaera giovannonii TaxID=406548 RepID=A0A5B9WBY2_9BACT|nr:hypothetical protein OJF2_63200 [Aquisphaera giovannonii]
MRRYELTDTQWARIAPMLPRVVAGKTGRPLCDHRPIVNGILWILRTGAPWRDLPERYGAWQTVFARFNRWRGDGTLDRLLAELSDEPAGEAGDETAGHLALPDHIPEGRRRAAPRTQAGPARVVAAPRA